MREVQGAGDRVEGLDVLRCIAVLGVVVVHTAQWLKPNSAFLQFLGNNAADGVILFYVLSSVSLLLGSERQIRDGSFCYRAYLIRRFFRIAPMFYMAIAGTLLAVGTKPSYWAPDGIGLGHLALTATFLHGLSPGTVNAIPPGSWSIAVEFSFYAIFPLMAIYCRTPKALFLLFGLTLAASLAFTGIAQGMLASYYPGSTRYLLDEWSTDMSLVGQLPVFVLGILVYKCVFARHLRTSHFAVFLAALVVVGQVDPFKKYPLAEAAISGLLVMIVLRWNSFFAQRKWMIHIGTVSYSIYLVHFFVIGFLKQNALRGFVAQNDWVIVGMWLGVVLASTAVATLAYRFVEQPFMRLGKTLAARVSSYPAVELKPAVQRDVVQSKWTPR